MTTLFVSDLDGTLLTNQATLSEFSRLGLKRLLDEGLMFTVATARSVVAVRQILDGIPMTLPVIEFNGAFISDLQTGRHEVIHSIERSVAEGLYGLIGRFDCVPFISTYNGSEDCVYFAAVVNDGMWWYFNDRLSARDDRWRRADDLTSAFEDHVVCFTVIHRQEVLSELRAAVEEEYGGRVQVRLFENHYSPGWYWLTIHDRKATKADALRTLRATYGLERAELVVFGDHNNDIEMFEIADRAIAVSNATEELKRHATHVIGSNEEDAVVRYLLEHWKATA